MAYGWSPYVPVAQRRAKAKKQMDKLRKKGKNIQPIEVAGRKIAKTFWGNAWCTHLEKFSDFSNRLPRGRTYVRNGSVCHLEIQKGKIVAKVSGSDIYDINISITPLSKTRWQTIKKTCAGEVGSILELLQGKLSDNVMTAVTNPTSGLFPQPKDIKLNCDCPDWATMCKHVAAVLYGIGARLDHSPELLFLLRGVDHMDLIDAEVKIPKSTRKKPQVSGDLSDIFGIDLDEVPSPLKKEAPAPVKKATKPKTAKSIATKKPVNKTPAAKKTSQTSAQKPSVPVINIARGIRASHIKKLRKLFDLTDLEFAKLLGKPVNTVRNWETKQGILNLRASSQTALEVVFNMNKEEAWERLGKSYQ
ncbi:hypothetical protein H0A36_12065 [Endozoicomonas sp. SM1973]|uniref:SWIM-type domain-containing protein n=1 Tax=Spartinivicinus marinus TaxID=2994442 RepID=A0A853IGR1_9GAMM|nr:hypothetical protein [Spartinivicinus marinus]MCX4026909.1 hypothetical protein [Spartinivicinus marinus]NYZ66746.1 hypothetical protein [Spartinivicinus marinus]